MAAEKKQHFFKICLTGEWGVGKTSLIHRWVKGTFSDNAEPTIAAEEIMETTVEHIPVKLKLCDTAGQERFRAITSSFYSGAHAVICVYDPAEPETSEALGQHLDEINRYAPESVLQFILCNKCDLNQADKKVNKDDVIAKYPGIPVYEGSAKTGTGVEEVLREVVLAIMKKKGLLEESRKKESEKGEGEDEGGKKKGKGKCTIL